MENSEYNFSGRNNRYGDFISDPGLMPKAGKPSSPLSKYNCGSSKGTLMAVWRSCSSENHNKLMFSKKKKKHLQTCDINMIQHLINFGSIL